jgi:hypothetical protein
VPAEGARQIQRLLIGHAGRERVLGQVQETHARLRGGARKGERLLVTRADDRQDRLKTHDGGGLARGGPFVVWQRRGLRVWQRSVEVVEPEESGHVAERARL